MENVIPENDMRSCREKRSHSVEVVELQKHCRVVLQSGASSLTNDLWLSSHKGHLCLYFDSG